MGMMEKHFVSDQNTISGMDFRRYVAAAKLFPGPTSTLIAIRIGQSFHGWRGGMLAWFALVAPPFFMVIGLSFIYQQTRNLPSGWWTQLTAGLNVGGLTLSVMAAIRFAKPLLVPETLFYFFASGILTFFYPQQEIFFLISCGILSLLHHHFKNWIFEASSMLVIPLFIESFKASLFTFGSGIAIVPALKAAYLDQYQWIDQPTFLTALSVGQMTPGPLVIMNSFLGHQVSGFAGAIASTLGTFLPTLIFGILLMPAFEKKLLDAKPLKAFFHGMLPAVGGAILGSVARLGVMTFSENGTELQLPSIVIFGILLAWGFIKNIHPILILLMGGAMKTVFTLLF